METLLCIPFAALHFSISSGAPELFLFDVISSACDAQMSWWLEGLRNIRGEIIWQLYEGTYRITPVILIITKQ